MEAETKLEVKELPFVRRPISERAKKLKRSHFHVTVSSNKRAVSDSQERQVVDSLITSARRVFGTMDGLSDVVIMRTEKGASSSDRIGDAAVFPAIDVKYGAEIGSHPKGSRIHLHALIKVNHYSCIWIDRKKIKRAFEADLGFGGVYVHIAIASAVGEYLEKSLQEAK